MTRIQHLTLGEFISAVFDELLVRYGDEDIAAVAASAVVNDLLSNGLTAQPTARAVTARVL